MTNGYQSDQQLDHPKISTFLIPEQLVIIMVDGGLLSRSLSQLSTSWNLGEGLTFHVSWPRFMAYQRLRGSPFPIRSCNQLCLNSSLCVTTWYLNQSINILVNSNIRSRIMRVLTCFFPTRHRDSVNMHKNFRESEGSTEHFRIRCQKHKSCYLKSNSVANNISKAFTFVGLHSNSALHQPTRF